MARQLRYDTSYNANQRILSTITSESKILHAPHFLQLKLSFDNNEAVHFK